MALLVGVSFHTPKGCRFDSQSGHIPGLLFPSLVEAHNRRQPASVSHIDVSLPHPFLSLSKINKHILG